MNTSDLMTELLDMMEQATAADVEQWIADYLKRCEQAHYTPDPEMLEMVREYAQSR